MLCVVFAENFPSLSTIEIVCVPPQPLENWTGAQAHLPRHTHGCKRAKGWPEQVICCLIIILIASSPINGPVMGATDPFSKNHHHHFLPRNNNRQFGSVSASQPAEGVGF